MATPLFFMHDGAIDELICIPFLQSMSNLELGTVWITPADCLGIPTAGVCEQIFDFIGTPFTGLFLSDSSSERPFPWTYRQYSLMVNLLPLLQSSSQSRATKTTRIKTRQHAQQQAKLVHEHIKHQNDAQGEATIVLVTCPLTDFAWLLESEPAMLSEIQSLTWMGGTLEAPGNIDTGIAIGANPNAEWNAYWDPYAVATVLNSGVTINMFPLDVTNQFLLTPDVLNTYFLPSASSSKMMNLACQMYAMVAFQAGFSFWDTAAAASLGDPTLFSFTPTNISINTDDKDVNGFGTLSTSSSGSSVNIASLAGTVASFYTYLTQQLETLG